jgi:hypothetical protein
MLSTRKGQYMKKYVATLVALATLALGGSAIAGTHIGTAVSSRTVHTLCDHRAAPCKRGEQ